MKTGILASAAGLAGIGSLVAAIAAPSSPPIATTSSTTIAKPRSTGWVRVPGASEAIANAPTGASSPTPSVREMRVEELAFAPWGSGEGELGNRRPSEANPEGPMAIAVDARGGFVVVDQVNGRLARYDAAGKSLGAIRLPSAAVQDVAFDPRGGFVFLDRLVDRAVIFVDERGAERARVAIEGTGVAEGGGVTALFSASDGAWVEYEHKSLVRVALASGEPDPERKTLEGRRTGEGALVRAARDPSGVAVVSVFGEPSIVGHAPGFLAKVDLGAPVSQLLDVEGAGGGRVVVAAHLVEESAAEPFDVERQAIALAVLDERGEVVARGTLPAPDRPDEQLRPITVGPEGTVYQLHVGVDGATIRRAR